MLEDVKCPTHGKGPTEVSLHFDGGNGDIKYQSCCEELGNLVKAKLG